MLCNFLGLDACPLSALCLLSQPEGSDRSGSPRRARRGCALASSPCAPLQIPRVAHCLDASPWRPCSIFFVPGAPAHFVVLMSRRLLSVCSHTSRPAVGAAAGASAAARAGAAAETRQGTRRLGSRQVRAPLFTPPSPRTFPVGSLEALSRLLRFALAKDIAGGLRRTALAPTHAALRR